MIRLIAALLFACVLSALAGVYLAWQDFKSGLQAVETLSRESFGADTFNYSRITPHYDWQQLDFEVHDITIAFPDWTLALPRLRINRQWLQPYPVRLQLPDTATIIIGNKTYDWQLSGGQLLVLASSEEAQEFELRFAGLNVGLAADQHDWLELGDTAVSWANVLGQPPRLEVVSTQVGWHGAAAPMEKIYLDTSMSPLLVKVGWQVLRDELATGETTEHGITRRQLLGALQATLNQTGPIGAEIELAELQLWPNDKQWWSVSGEWRLEPDLRPAGRGILGTNDLDWLLRKVRNWQDLAPTELALIDIEDELAMTREIAAMPLLVRQGNLEIGGFNLGPVRPVLRP